MAKVQCPVCMNEISNKAQICPHCRSDQKSARKYMEAISVLRAVLNSPQEIEDAENKVKEFVDDELGSWEDLAESTPTVMLFEDNNFFAPTNFL